jgi:hypothetical protein
MLMFPVEDVQNLSHLSYKPLVNPENMVAYVCSQRHQPEYMLRCGWSYLEKRNGHGKPTPSQMHASLCMV